MKCKVVREARLLPTHSAENIDFPKSALTFHDSVSSYKILYIRGHALHHPGTCITPYVELESELNKIKIS